MKAIIPITLSAFGTGERWVLWVDEMPTAPITSMSTRYLLYSALDVVGRRN